MDLYAKFCAGRDDISISDRKERYAERGGKRERDIWRELHDERYQIFWASVQTRVKINWLHMIDSNSIWVQWAEKWKILHVHVHVQKAISAKINCLWRSVSNCACRKCQYQLSSIINDDSKSSWIYKKVMIQMLLHKFSQI